MEHHRSLAIANLKGLIAMREAERKRLQAIIAYSSIAEERTKALGDLATVIKAIGTDSDSLATLESGQRSVDQIARK